MVIKILLVHLPNYACLDCRSYNPLCDLAILKAQPIGEDIFPLSSLDEMTQGDEVDIMGCPHCVTDW